MGYLHHIVKNFSSTLIIFVLTMGAIWVQDSVSAQPVNDNWANALDIPISNQNFGVGVFNSPEVTLSGATNQTGEYLYDPTYPKTVWYKFRIPSHRSVRIKTLQPTEILNQNDAGFVVYKSTPGVPGQSDLAIFTPFLCLACYSENICLEQGEYYVQLVAKNVANSNVYIELDVAYTYPVSTTFAADQIANKHDLGTVTYNNAFNFNWDCLSLESNAEYSNVIGADSLLYNKSIWFKFDTDDHIDLFAYNLYQYPGGDLYAIRIYEGDINLADLTTAVPIYESLQNVIYSGSSTYLTCLLDSNTTYTVQLLGHEDYTGAYTFQIYHLGEGQVTGAYPQEAAWNPLNNFGTITPLPAPGLTSELFDYFSCEALLTNDSIQCGTANPVDSMYYDPVEYDLTTWFTLSTTAESNATFRARTRRTSYCNSDYYNHSMRIRIWHQNTDNDCDSYVFPDDLFYDGQLDGNGQVILNCLPTGDFAIQLLGRSQLDGNAFDCTNSQFGSKVTLSATLSAVPSVQFGLTTAGDVDWINTGNPLLDNILYTADSARFSCTKTILPDTAICDDLVDRAIYRQVIIGDADGDAVADSGMIVLTDYLHYNYLQNHVVKSVFYKGDAADLSGTQGISQWPDEITGLEPFDGCNMWTPFFRNYWSPTSFALYNSKKYCVTPGTYTLASVGDSTENGALSLPKFRFLKQPTTQFSDFENPENMGDIIAQGLAVTSQPDYFSCLDNPDTVGGLAPCPEYTKQLYREFYLSEDCRITVNEVNSSGFSGMRLYYGRASDIGLDSVILAPFHSTNCYSGNNYSYFSLPACATVPAGWYTVVSYGYGPNYENNFDFHEDQVYTNWDYGLYNINETSTVTVTADTTELPGPFFNKPYKACVASDTIKYINLATVDYPTSSTSYNFCMERFKFVTDTPYVNVPIIGCENTERLSFYVFTTDDEYFTVITGISNFYKELYPLDVRTDSLLLLTTLPLTNCDGFNNDIAICRLQPGTYTLVVYGTAAQNCNITFAPAIRVAPVEVSRFDFAAHAYDFDLIPGDNMYYGGKVGDVHPNNPNLLPSDDTFYCTTGAFQDDPGSMCWSAYYDGVYPDTLNNAYFNEPGSTNGYIERNLWYTFVAQGMGTATMKIQNLTGASIPTFFVYRSDVDGNIPFDELISLGELDSTLSNGLELIVINRNSGCNTYTEATFTFLPDICVEDTLKRRYYIVAEITEAITGKPNLQMNLQVKWNPILANPVDPLYDFYHTANVIGDDEIAPPYTGSPLEYDTFYEGGWGNMSCATGDTTDQVVFGSCIPQNQKSLWWKFTLDEPGFLYLGTEMDDYYGYYARNLLEQVAPGDSIISPQGINGLLNLGQGDYGTPITGDPAYDWRRFCVDPGTYYYHIARCAEVDTSAIRGHAYFTPISGDRCVDALGTTGPTYGSYPVSVPILCHSMGSDFGEDGSGMSCLQGPEGYNSTWFQFSYTGPDLVDILFQLNLSQLSYYNGTQNVRYRLFYGDDCATMIEGLECSNNAFINNSVACISEAAGDFYVQVTYPESASGTLGFNFTVSPNTNPDCNPFNPTLLISDFISQMNCTGDSLIFTNYGTSGSSLTYHWDFGWNGNTSTEANPIFAYPADGPYDVTLSVINPILGDTASITYEVIFDTSGSPLELGSDQTICIGETAMIGGFISQATYNWSTGENTYDIQVSSSGLYWVDLSLNGCSYSDTVAVDVIDLNFDLGLDEQICLGDTLILNHDSPYQVGYLWSTGSVADSTIIVAGGNYWLEVNFGNCTSSDSISVDLIDLSFILGNDTTICEGTSFVLSPVTPPNVNFNWSSGETTPDITVLSAGVYNLEVSANGCYAMDSLKVYSLDLELELGTDTVICQGTNVMLNPTTNVVVNYLWYDGSTLPNFSASQEGWYSLQVDSAACFARDSIFVEVLDLAFELPADTIICPGASLTILPDVLPNVGFTWSTGETTNQIIVTQEDLYTLIIDSLQCTYQSDILVTVRDLSFQIGNDTILCQGDDLLIQPDVFSGVSYIWSSGAQTSSLTVDTIGTYSLEVALDGCSYSDSLFVDIFEVSPVIPASLSACLYDTTLVSISGVDSVLWQNGSNIEVLNSLTFEFYPSSNQTYNWVAYDTSPDGKVCSTSGQMSFDVVQPMIPTYSFDDLFCRNELNIVPPEMPYTIGAFYFDDEVFSTLNIGEVGSGNHEMIYQYTDTNTCTNAISIPFTIADTTTISWTAPFPEMCPNSQGLALSAFTSHPGNQFSWVVGIDTIFSSAFLPETTDPTISTPTPVSVHFTFVNNDGCISQIAQEIMVHSYPIALFTVGDVCLNDTLMFDNNTTVVGSSIAHNNWSIPGFGNLDIFEPQSISFSTSGFYEIGLTVVSEIGCTAQYTDSVEVFPLPQLTSPVFGPFCNNDALVDLPTPSPDGGIFTMAGNSIGSINPSNLGSGNHVIDYFYTDSNVCSNQLEIHFVINDTTTTTFDLPSSLCINADALQFNSHASHVPGIFIFDNGSGPDTLNVFNPELIPDYSGFATEINVQYIYQNTAGCLSAVQSSFTVQPAPTIAFTVGNSCLNDTLEITNTSSVNGGALTNYNWEFDGWGNASDPIPIDIHYGDAGIFTAVLTATSEFGCTNSLSETFEVYPLPLLQADTYGPWCLNDGAIPLPTTSTLGGEFIYNNSEITALNTYTLGVGQLLIEYHFTDSNTCYNQIDIPFVISDTTSISFVNSLPSLCVNAGALNLLPFASHLPAAFSFSYNLNDTDTVFSGQFDPLNAAGNPAQVEIYWVNYAHTNTSGCTSLITDNLILHPLPIVEFDIPDVCVFSELSISNITTLVGSAIESFLWEFQENQTSQVFEPTGISYDLSGDYITSLTVTSEIGCSAIAIDTLTVFDLPELSYDPFGSFCQNEGVLPFPIVTPSGGTFSNSGGVLTSFDTYDFVGGPNLLIYAFTDANQCSNSIEIPFTIRDTTDITFTGTFPERCINALPLDLSGYLSHQPAFTEVNYNANSWIESNEVNPSLIQNFTGNPYNVPVRYTYINDEGCTSRVYEFVKVHPLPVLDILVPDVCLNEPLEILNNSFVVGSEIESIGWSFSSGDDFTTYNVPGLWFDAPAEYAWEVTIESTIGCINSRDDAFQVHHVPESSFTSEGECDNEMIAFNANSTIGEGAISNYVWWMAGDEIDGEAAFAYQFFDWGAHEVGLSTISQYGCRDTILDVLFIHPAPISSISAEDHCFENSVQISTEIVIPNGSVTQVVWASTNEFEYLNTMSFEHIFGTPGTKNIIQFIESDAGCTTISQVSLEVFALPIPAYQSSDTAICQYGEIDIWDASLAFSPQNIDIVIWSTSDGQGLLGAEGTVSAYQQGPISLEQTVITDFGCSATHYYDDFLVVWPNPEAHFGTNASQIQISNPVLTIKDESRGNIMSWLYDMGDSHTYSIAEPTHRYESTGNYEIWQQVTNEFGCIDSIRKIITVGGFIVYIPNSFTPNGDGINDIFHPSVIGAEIDQYVFRIYNRWGREVFFSSDAELGWNGASPGEDYYGENSIYNYHLLIKGKNTEIEEFKGSITLIR